DSDTDTDTDSDTDSDTDTDTDTIPLTWSWGSDITVEQAQASYVGESPGDAAGYLSVAGDLNGDGIDDLSIGANGYSAVVPEGGKVYVVYGRAGSWSLDMPLEDVPSVWGNVTYQQLYVTRALGDVNGDGLADMGIVEYGGFTVDEYVM